MTEQGLIGPLLASACLGGCCIKPSRKMRCTLAKVGAREVERDENAAVRHRGTGGDGRSEPTHRTDPASLSGVFPTATPHSGSGCRRSPSAARRRLSIALCLAQAAQLRVRRLAVWKRIGVPMYHSPLAAFAAEYRRNAQRVRLGSGVAHRRRRVLDSGDVAAMEQASRAFRFRLVASVSVLDRETPASDDQQASSR